MKRTILIISALLAGFSFGIALAQKKLPPTVVQVVKAQQKQWQPSIEATGSLSAFNGIMLSAEVAGRITKIHFVSGKYVHAGELLLEIYPNVIQAQLAHSKAQLKQSEVDYQRNLKLYKKGFVDKATLDTKIAQRDEDQADVNSFKAQLNQHLIHAPFSGKLGLRKISLGDYVNPGQPLVNLQSIDPIRVDFSVPQQYFDQIKVGDRVVISSKALPKNYTGTIYALESKVDENTRMLDMRAKIANGNHILVPGTFVEVKIKIKHAEPVVVIPATAIVYSEGDNYVYRMINHKAVQTKVTLRKLLKNNQVIVEKGLRSGDLVIIGGQVKLFNGAPVATEQEYQQMINK
jgi:membrane fusion protein (multidrug efflux system)